MPMIGGTTSWLGPVVGAVLLGALQQIATVTISSAVELLIVGVLLVAFVVPRPRASSACSRREARDDEPLLEVAGLGKRFGGFIALDGDRPRGAAGRAPRPDRPERLGQDTLINCISGTLRIDGGRCASTARRDGLPAHQRTRLGMARSFQIPRPSPA